MAEYIPSPYTRSNIEQYLMEELNKISRAITLLADNPIEIRNVAPDKPRNGLYYADGTNWNPGSGKGVYRYDEGTDAYTHLG
jgi:hypothetical protein